MSDPWEEFAAHEGDGELAGYFERAAAGREPGQAYWFTGKADHLVVDRSSSLAELRRDTDGALRRRGSAVIGYLGFDAVGLFEPALAQFPTGSPFPLGEFALPRSVHRAPVPRRPREGSVPVLPPPPRHDSLPRPRFERSVRRLIGDIRDGEAFQVVLAHRRRWRTPQDPVRAAGTLRRRERYAYFYYLKFGDRLLTGASPESVVELRGRSAWVDPIAGTSPVADGRSRRSLSTDPKELAEHRMLVDLARNDLGAVAQPGSVRLEWKERRIRYARLDHLVSRVAGRLAPGRGPWDLLASTFPAGTVSGAPKIRAVELLRREEATWRGPYAGSVGLLLPRGEASWALAIRSAFAAGRDLFTAAGAGIVHRSRPRREWEESLAKLSLVENVFADGGR